MVMTDCSHTSVPTGNVPFLGFGAAGTSGPNPLAVVTNTLELPAEVY